MKRNFRISFKTFNNAVNAIGRELTSLGLWELFPRLQQTNIFWCPIPQLSLPLALGFHIDSIDVPVSISERMWRWLGYEEGNIYIPSISLVTLFCNKRWSLRNVIRHEYGHNLAYHYPKLVRGKHFRDVFGGAYSGKRTRSMHNEAFVTEYAKTCPAEDFAETFAVFVQKKGKLSMKTMASKLSQKFNFVRRIVN